jgi:hypothetical protein
MKREKSIGIVTTIAILLLSLATTLGNFSPISHAQVEQQTDQAAQDLTADEVSTEEQCAIGEHFDDKTDKCVSDKLMEDQQVQAQDLTADEVSTEEQTDQTAAQDVTNANDTEEQTDQTAAQDLTADEVSTEEQTDQAGGEDITQAIEQGALEQAGGKNITQAIEQGALEQAGGEDITQAIEEQAIQKAAGVDAVQKIDQVATQIANSSAEAQTTEDSEEAGASTIEQTIEQIALQTAQVGGNANQIINQIAQQVASNPKGPIAQAIQQLAKQYAEGNTDEVQQAAKQIGTQIAKGQNIQQTLVQISNQVINNINNINTKINNYNNVKIHSTSPTQTKVIQETVNTLKAEKPLVKVPRIHIEFDNNKERNLVLRVLNTLDAKYDMPFSKYNGPFILNDNEFKVKLIGKGKILSAAVSEMKNNGDIGPREFLDKDVRNGKVFFGLDDVKKGKYLLDVYIKLSNGSIGTFARGSITIR